MADPNDPAEYKLHIEFSAASIGFQTELILIKKGDTEDDDTYEHICTVGDINRYTMTRGTDLYYRVAAWDQFFANLEDLAAEVLVQQGKAQYVVTDWETYTGGVIDQPYDHTYNA
jgi:hypothetical protein